MTNPIGCPTLGPALLSTWNLNDLEISPGLEVQGNQLASSIAPLHSIWFTAATTTRAANDHGLLVNLDPAANRFRIWDLDTRLGIATGLGANFLAQDSGALWATSAVPVVHRVDPLSRGQWTWTLPVTPFDHTIRGITVMPNGSLMISLENTQGPGRLFELNPTTDTLVHYDLPTETAPFGGSLAPDGTFYFCEFFTNRIARLDLTAPYPTDNLTEWQLPGDSRPERIDVSPSGEAWFTDQTRVGRLDPAQATVSFFEKEGVVPLDVAPMFGPPSQAHGPGQPPPLFVVADRQNSVDILCASPTTGIPVPVITSRVNGAGFLVTPAPSRPLLSAVELTPNLSAEAPVDPPRFNRYATQTPTLAAVQHLGALYAIGTEFLARTFRAYRLDTCSVIREDSAKYARDRRPYAEVHPQVFPQNIRPGAR